jgi:hypothetical protein
MGREIGEERQRLAEAYAEKYDGELLELAADVGNLTEIAQQVLRDEMQKRGLNADAKPALQTGPAEIHEEPSAGASDFGYNSQPATVADEKEPDGPLEFTWKTELCECPTIEQARQLAEALKRAGIESWIQAAGVNTRYGAFDITYPKLMVAADQLEEAKAVAARPISQDIIDALKAEEKEEPEEFETPKCPACGSDDTVLIGVDVGNTWQCEACEHEWSDPIGEADGADSSGVKEERAFCRIRRKEPPGNRAALS